MTRSRRAAELVAALFFLFIGFLVVLVSRHLPYWLDVAPGPGFVPLWLGSILSVVAALQFCLAAAASIEAPATDGGVADAGPTETGGDPPLGRRTALLGALSVAMLFLVPLLGFVLATAVFVAIASWTIDPARRLVNLAATIGIPLCVWALFVVWLGVPLPKGPFGF